MDALVESRAAQQDPFEAKMPCVSCLLPWECCVHARQQSRGVHEDAVGGNVARGDASLQDHVSPAYQFRVTWTTFGHETRSTHDSDDIVGRFWGTCFGQKAQTPSFVT